MDNKSENNNKNELENTKDEVLQIRTDKLEENISESIFKELSTYLKLNINQEDVLLSDYGSNMIWQYDTHI